MGATETTAPQQIILTPEQFAELLKGSRLSKEDQIELIDRQAKANAEENRKQLKPENATHPGVSVFSRIGGEIAHPKGEFPYKIVWAGYPIDKDTVTADEFDLLVQLTPGEYLCDKPDGTKFKVDITATRNETTGKIDTLDVFFATRGQLRHGLPSMVSMCRELIAQAASPVKVA